jgi:hypothetical protein
MPNAPSNAADENPEKDQAKLAGNEEKNSDGQSPDYAALSVEAINRHTTSPEFTAKYKAWLEYLGPEHWTPVAKADYEAMSKENIDPELVARYRAELESNRVPPAKKRLRR